MSLAPPERLILSACVVDLVDARIHRGGDSVPLTRIECALLGHLAAHPGEVVDRGTLLRRVWGHEQASGTRAVDIAVLRLRRKIETDPGRPDHLQTVRGKGYRLAWTSAERRTNLGAEITSFVGRAAELAALREALASGRFVTLVGPPGAGKTRLAREVGASVLGDWPGGVWFCDLTPARDAAAVVDAVARALEVPLLGGVDPVGPALAAKGPVLVLLDNFEQVTAAAARTAGRWLGTAPEARFLVTSREPLRLPGEVVLRLDPLPEPDAVALFLERARALRRDFGTGQADAVAEIVARLDRLPLALELAAGRAGLLSAPALRDRLRETLGLASGGGRDRTGRQASLRGAVAWSWRLLDERERTALALCSVFRGGFPIAAAEAVLDDPKAGERLRRLQERSLLAPRGAGRVALYESVRELAGEQLVGPRLAEAEDRHAAWFLAHTEALLRQFERQGTRDLASALRAEIENLRAVFERMEARRPGDAVRAALVLAGARASEAPGTLIDLLDRALPLATAAGGRARVLAARATAVMVSGWLEDGRRDAEEAVALAAGDPALESRAFAALARVLEERGDFADSLAASGRGIACAEAAGDRDVVAHHHRRAASACIQLNDLDAARGHLRAALAAVGGRDGSPSRRAALESVAGTLEHMAGNLDLALHHHAEAVSLARSLGQQRYVATHVGNLGSVYADLGDLDRATSCHLEALAIVQDLGLRRTEANAWANLALIAAAAGDGPVAVARAEHGLTVSREIGAWLPEAGALMALGMVALERGEPAEAVSRIGAAWKLMEARGEPEFAPVVRAWLGAAVLRAGGDASEHLRAARASGLSDAVAVCDVVEGRPVAHAPVHVRVAQRVFASA